MSTQAAFRARNITTSGPWSNFSAGGFDAAAGDVIEVQLESNPAPGIWMMQFSCVDKSNGRSVPVFSPSTGIATVPTAAVQLTMPPGEHGTWEIQGQANGGPQSADGTTDPTFTCSRYFAVRTPNLHFRHMLAAETIQYLAAGGWAVAMQELMDAIDTAAAGAPVSGHYWLDSTTVPAELPSAVATRALASPLTASRIGAAGSSLEGLGVGRGVTGGAAGTTGTGLLFPFKVANGAGTQVDAALIEVLWSNVAGPDGDLIVHTKSAGTMAPRMRIGPTGLMRWYGYTSAGTRPVFDGSGNITATAISESEVRTALAASAGAVTFNGQNLSSIGDLVVGGNLTVQGTTTTVNSTAVSLADRLVVFNSSTGIVPVPSAIAGWVIDRGSADGVTKRDMPGIFWDESGGQRLVAAYNTAGDQSTIGALAAFLAGAIVARTDGIATTKTNALTAQNATAATALATRQFSGAVSRKGAAWVSAANRSMEVLDELEPRPTGALDWVFYYNTGSGIAEGFRYTTSTAGQFTQALQSYNLAFSFSVFNDTTNSGFFTGGDNGLHVKNREGKGIWYSDEDLEIQTGGANARAYFDTSGDLISFSVNETRVRQLAAVPFDNTFAATLEIDWDKGFVQRVPLTGNITSLTNKNVRPGALCVLIFTQDSTGGRTVTFEPGHFEHATALGAALGSSGTTRTAYTFIGHSSVRLTPIAAPLPNIVIP